MWGKGMKDWTGIDFITNTTYEIIRQQRERKEQTLAEIITKYDFIVGSVECKHRLMERLPEEAKITCTPYIESPTMIYAVKKFDIMDLLKEQHKAESEADKESEEKI